MKRETMEKREKEMKKFKMDTGDNNDGGDDLLEELGGLEDDEESLHEEPIEEEVIEEQPVRYFNEEFKQ